MPAIFRQRLICAPSSVAAPAFGSPCAEEPRLRRLELVYVVVVVGEQCPRRLHVARPRDLKLEADALLVAPAAQLVHLLAERLRALGGLGSFGDLALELGDARVALLERRLVVRARLGDAAFDLGCRAAVCGNTLAATHLRRHALRLLRRALVDLLRLVLQTIHLPVLSIRRAKKKPAPKRWVQAIGASQKLITNGLYSRDGLRVLMIRSLGYFLSTSSVTRMERLSLDRVRATYSKCRVLFSSDLSPKR